VAAVVSAAAILDLCPLTFFRIRVTCTPPASTRALESFGMRCEIFCFDEFPISSTISFDLDPRGPLLRGPQANGRLGDFTLVWNRRGWDPVLPAGLHQEDRRLALPVCRRYCDELRLAPPPGQVWVNSRVAQLRMRSKALQLDMARGLGFQVPETLITNDPEAARRFVGGSGDCIVKSISPMRWEEEGKVIALPTSPVSVADLDDDETVSACPMVYQRLVPKLYELRVLVFGDELLCVKIHSQDAGRYLLDWRKGVAGELRLERIVPPPQLESRIRAFCTEAELLHASFDLAVTPENGIVFFEVNEQGQTLWIEEVNEALPVFAMLVGFLWRAATGEAPPGADALRLRDYLESPVGSEGSPSSAQSLPCD
jgi:glutathione synthase/RimK-type ligase-like ATP-grasp enzyme